MYFKSAQIEMKFMKIFSGIWFFIYSSELAPAEACMDRAVCFGRTRAQANKTSPTTTPKSNSDEEEK